MSDRIDPTRQAGSDWQLQRQVDVVDDNFRPYGFVPPRGFPAIDSLSQRRRHFTPCVSGRNADLRNSQANRKGFPEPSGASASDAHGRVDLCFCCDLQCLLCDVEWCMHRGLIEFSCCLCTYQCRQSFSKVALVWRCQDYASTEVHAR